MYGSDDPMYNVVLEKMQLKMRCIVPFFFYSIIAISYLLYSESMSSNHSFGSDLWPFLPNQEPKAAFSVCSFSTALDSCTRDGSM